jgi:hypothetical protein
MLKEVREVITGTAELARSMRCNPEISVQKADNTPIPG